MRVGAWRDSSHWRRRGVSSRASPTSPRVVSVSKKMLDNRFGAASASTGQQLASHVSFQPVNGEQIKLSRGLLNFRMELYKEDVQFTDQINHIVKKSLTFLIDKLNGFNSIARLSFTWESCTITVFNLK